MSHALIFLCIVLQASLAFAQPTGVGSVVRCDAVSVETHLVSDRFEDVVQYGNQLILANAHGLSFMDVDNLGPRPMHVVPLSGQVTEVFLNGDQLLAAVLGVGIYAFEYDEDAELPRQTNFFSIPGLQSAAIVGETIFALTDNGLRFFRTDPLEFVDTLDVYGLSIEANNSLVFVHGADARIATISYDQSGFTAEPSELSVDGNQIFYGMKYAGEALVVDTLDGLKWLTFNEKGGRSGEGFFFRNQGRNIVLGFDATDTRLILSFATRIEVYNYDIARRTTLLGQIPQKFRDVGITRLRSTESHLHLLNIASTGRNWSLESFDLAGGAPTSLNRLPARFSELTAAVTLNEQVLFAVDRQIMSLAPDNTGLTSVITLPGPIQDLVVTENTYLLATVTQGDASTGLYVFRDNAGELTEIFSDSVQGDVRNVTQFLGSFAFSRFFRTTSNERYTAYTLTPQPTSATLTMRLDSAVDIGAPDPFAFLQLGAEGLVFWDQEQVWFLGENDQEPIGYTLDTEFNVIGLAAPGNDIWVQTDANLLVAERQRQALTIVARHPSWTNLSRQANNQVLAINKQQGPSRYHVMTFEDNLLYNSVSFGTSTRPLLVSERDEALFVVERASVSSHEYQCPNPDIHYMLPVDVRFEVDMSTDLGPGEQAVLNIFDESGSLIGLQSLTPALIGRNNGQPILDWVSDYNHQRNPAAVVLSATVPMGPVISGQAASNINSRFAVQLPPWEEEDLFVTHIPNDFGTWETRVMVNALNTRDTVSQLQIAGSFDETRHFQTRLGELKEFRIDADTFSPASRWARVFAEDFDTQLNGFTQIQAPGLGLAAAVPLSGDLSTSLFVPFLAGKSNPGWWTGLVMANPHPASVRVRIIGYDERGELSLDRARDVPAHDSLVIPVEDWIAEQDPGAQIQWLALVAEAPITGMTLFSTYSRRQLAGLPLATRPGQHLLFTGIRSDSTWRTSLVLTTINLERSVLKLTAVSHDGSELAVSGLEMPSRASLQFNVRDLFANLGSNLRDIQTIRVESSTEVIGFIFRNRRGTDSLEAISAIEDVQLR